jgi:nickel-dependent lactate racemase
MNIPLPYGESYVDVSVPDDSLIVTQDDVPGLADEGEAAATSFRAPGGAAPLRDMVKPGESVAIVINDITRPTPNSRILPWVLRELAHVLPENIVIIIGNGTHRPCTDAEIRLLVGDGVYGRIETLNHDAFNPSACTRCGSLADGTPVLLNSRYVRASKRIGIGFIEPHFFAGFSGGPKVIMPGVAGMETIRRFHSPAMITHPKSDWGELDGNPVHEMSLAVAKLCPPDFTVNVALNRAGRITGFFSGEMRDAHRRGAHFVGAHAMKRVDRRFDVVVTTNNGYPLDQNLYQAVKGICAAHRIVKPGGDILCLAECRDGVPGHGNFKTLMQAAGDPEALIEKLTGPEYDVLDRWQALKLALALRDARVHLYSSLPGDAARSAHMLPCSDPSHRLGEILSTLHGRADVAVLPQGPLAVPYRA